MTFQAQLPTGDVDAEEVRRVTEEVLSRPEYVEARPSLLERAIGTVLEVIGRFLELLSGGGRGSVIGTILLAVLCAAVLYAAARFLRRVRRDPEQAVAETGPVGRGAEEWLADAEGLERRQEWRQALRCRYRALIAELAASGLVEEVAGRTSGEYLTAVAGDLPAAADAFADATRAFEGAWYGAASVTEEDVVAFRRAAAEVRRTAGPARRRQPAGETGVSS